MKRMLVVLLLAVAFGVFANPIAILYLNEVQIKPIPRFEIFVHNTAFVPNSYPIDFINWKVCSSSGQLLIDDFTLTADDSIRVITDTEIYGDFTLNHSVDSLLLIDEIGYYVDGVKWPEYFSPPDSGASAAVACSTVYPGYPELPYNVYVWHTNRQPSFGQENPDIPYGVENNKQIEINDIKPWLNAFPNPAKSRTVISFSVPIGGKYKLNIYDLAGRLVNGLDNGTGDGKYFTVIWDGKNKGGRKVSAGNYLVVLECNGQKHTKRITLIK